MKDNSMVEVRFKKNYIASRGPGIAGVKDSCRHFRMTDSLKALLDDGTLELVKKGKAESRKKATGKKGGEKS